MISFWIQSDRIRNGIYIPKYYNPEVESKLDSLGVTHDFKTLGELIDMGAIAVSTGDEIGKNAYGTGDIPFVRTSDISNWEIKSFPKQGISEDIYSAYFKKQNVCEGDIFFVRDGTYLIGTNCFVTNVDRELVFQSHILKFTVIDKKVIDPALLFLLLNSDVVQKQIRSFQFTADIIDTIGNRYLDIILPIPKDAHFRNRLSSRAVASLNTRKQGKAFIKAAPYLLEEALASGSSKPFEVFQSLSDAEIVAKMEHFATTSEFGEFEAFWIDWKSLKDYILLPKYYEPSISQELKNLSANCDCISLGELRNRDLISWSTGVEVGKLGYGTGTIPFFRTSDFANWELKHDPKQGVSRAIYNEYEAQQDVAAGDIFLVRDGTYLVGSSCIVTEEDAECLYCGGLLKLRSLDWKVIDPYLLLGLLNSFIVKRQIRTKQFTRDVIDTLGNRIEEVVIPIPKSSSLRQSISSAINKVISSRIQARKEIEQLSAEIAN